MPNTLGWRFVWLMAVDWLKRSTWPIALLALLVGAFAVKKIYLRNRLPPCPARQRATADGARPAGEPVVEGRGDCRRW